MADRFTLIARKETVRQRISQLQRELAQVQAQQPPAPRQIARLQQQLEQLMAEEYNLRIAIDQAAH